MKRIHFEFILKMKGNNKLNFDENLMEIIFPFKLSLKTAPRQTKSCFSAIIKTVLLKNKARRLSFLQ